MRRKIFTQLFLQGAARLGALQIPKRQLCGNLTSIGRTATGYFMPSPYPLNDLAGAIIATGVRWRQGDAIVLRLFRSAPRDVFVLCVTIYLYVYRAQTTCLCSGCALKNPQNGSKAPTHLYFLDSTNKGGVRAPLLLQG